MIADGQGRALAFAPAPGQAHERPWADALPKALPRPPKGIVAGQGDGSHALRGRIWGMGARPAIFCKSNEGQAACPAWICVNRSKAALSMVERLRGRIKAGRAIATRYEKTACSFRGVLHLKAALDWVSGPNRA